MKKRIAATIILALTSGAALAMEPFVVRDIRVEGLQRTDAGSVFGYIPVKVGDIMTDEIAAASIKSLYATGFFKHVKIEAQDGVLIIAVEERPSVAKLNISGVKEFSDEDIINGLKQSGLAKAGFSTKASWNAPNRK